jgi:hypothetical protein
MGHRLARSASIWTRSFWPVSPQRRLVSGSILAGDHEKVSFFGTITINIDGELDRLDANGYRPLRVTPDDRAAMTTADPTCSQVSF